MTGPLRERVEAWAAEDPDPAAREELQRLLDAGDTEALTARFAEPLSFGTAGLRGPLRAGPSGMNRAVVRRTTAGLAAYLDATARTGPVVIGYDARHGSADFARDAAAVVAGAEREALLLPRPLPTPVLAFAVRHLRAAAGVMVTASHNPPRDNGYKVYLGDGAQIVPPADREIEAAIAAVGPLSGVALDEDHRALGDEVLDDYLAEVCAVAEDGSSRDIAIAYTPMHGVGGDVLVEALARAGFARPAVVAEQADPDPDFSTVPFPNPEEPGAMDLVLALARRTGADIAIANDPDADRCAVACGGRLLTGDEVGVLLGDTLLRRGRSGTYATTIVSSSLLGRLCERHGMPYAETLTGFKWIMRAAGEEADGGLAYGYEEALGYSVAPTVVRDKDGISAALLVAELAAELKTQGRTLADRLDELANEHGVHATDQVSIRVADLRLIGDAMARLRADPPRRLLGADVDAVDDLLPDADVVRLRAGRARVVVRPSGTEPKLKIYLELVVPVSGGRVTEARASAAESLARLRDELSARLQP